MRHYGFVHPRRKVDLEWLLATYTTTIGNSGLRGRGGYLHSILVQIQATERLNYVVEHDLLRLTETGEDTVGLNQYLTYSLTDRGPLAREWSGGRRMGSRDSRTAIRSRPHVEQFVLRSHDWGRPSPPSESGDAARITIRLGTVRRLPSVDFRHGLDLDVLD